jgi:hypothetical protein
VNGLATRLKKVWGDDAVTEARRAVIIFRMLGGYEKGEIEKRLLTRDDIGKTKLGEAIRALLDKPAAISMQEVVEELLSEPLATIGKEKGKFEYIAGEPVKIGVRAVKGQIYGMYGLSAGVCTATDVELWKNPKFRLLAITDEGTRQVVGYVHTFETEEHGKRYLTLPGINPSAEFMATVDGRRLYDGIIEQVIKFARAGGYEGVYIPTESNIHSNRSMIQKAIAEKKYRAADITEVQWNTLPEPYPFARVYVAWERAAPEAGE